MIRASPPTHLVRSSCSGSHFPCATQPRPGRRHTHGTGNEGSPPASITAGWNRTLVLINRPGSGVWGLRKGSRAPTRVELDCPQADRHPDPSPIRVPACGRTHRSPPLCRQPALVPAPPGLDVQGGRLAPRQLLEQFLGDGVGVREQSGSWQRGPSQAAGTQGPMNGCSKADHPLDECSGHCNHD